MDQDSAHMVAASKGPMLKPSKYEIRRIRIEQYIQMMDYALWELIGNGATLPKIQVVEGVTTEMPITTAKEKAQRRLKVKAKTLVSCDGLGGYDWSDQTEEGPNYELMAFSFQVVTQRYPITLLV
nr:hypothetical protein [Tanacetum cinerariifolium]